MAHSSYSIKKTIEFTGNLAVLQPSILTTASVTAATTTQRATICGLFDDGTIFDDTTFWICD